MSITSFLRGTLALVLVLILAACGGTTNVDRPTAAPITNTNEAVTGAPSLTATATPARPAPTKLPDPTHASPAMPTVQTTAIPAATATPIPQPTAQATAIPAATATPVPQSSAIPAATATHVPQASQLSTYIYAFPVRSEGQISYSRYHHTYPAADIFCPIGSEFVAVTDGVVDYVNFEDVWDPATNDGATRGGLSVAIIGDDGVRYYGSHLSQVADGIAPGVRVAVGQRLGLTGKSGDARNTDPHLHFGISRPTTPEDWEIRRGEIPPYEYLRAWQAGESMTPALP